MRTIPTLLSIPLFIAVALLTLRGADAQPNVPSLRPAGLPTSGGLYVLSGSLHDHSSDSDGDASSRAVAAWEFAHRVELGIDFGALTEHADFLPFAYRAPFGGNVWNKQARIDAQYSRDGFSFLRGFEYTSDQENHVNIIGSSDFLGGRRNDDLTLAALHDWLVPRSGVIAEFNHPSAKGALQWNNLTFDPSIAANFAAIEIFGDQEFSPLHLSHSDAGWYWLALTRGWTLGPVMDWDAHNWREMFRQHDVGSRCGDQQTLPCQRTLVLADAPTPAGIMRALNARRTSATQHPSLWVTLRGPDGAWQGSTVHVQTADSVALMVEAGSSNWPLNRIDIISDGGINPHRYYDGDNDLHNAEGAVAASFAEQHRRYVNSGGYTLRKAEIDSPPRHAIVASVPIDGHHATRVITVNIPFASSMRPDKKHFFYAIVWAGGVRAWTSPIFVEDASQYGYQRLSPSSSSRVRGQSAPKSRESARSASSFPPV